MTSRARQQGELENAVLQVLWDARAAGTPDLSSNEVLERLESGKDLALTTILTVLSRLCEKDLVKRQPGTGRSLLFSSITSREEHDANVMLRVLSTSNNPALAFSHFAKELDPQVLELLKQSLSSNPE